MSRLEREAAIAYDDSTRKAKVVIVDGDDYDEAFDYSFRGRKKPWLTRVTGGRWKPKAWSTTNSRNIFTTPDAFGGSRWFDVAIGQFFGVEKAWKALFWNHRGLHNSAVFSIPTEESVEEAIEGTAVDVEGTTG